RGGDQCEPVADGSREEVPRRPVLSIERRDARPAPIARPARRCAAARRVLPAAVLPAGKPQVARAVSRGPAADAGARLAGKYSRTAEPDGTGGVSQPGRTG